MVIDKPANMVVHPGVGNYSGSLLNGISYYLQKKEERIASEMASVEKAKNLFVKELDWMRRQPKVIIRSGHDDFPPFDTDNRSFILFDLPEIRIQTKLFDFVGTRKFVAFLK